MIKYDDLPQRIIKTIFECGNTSIDMSVNTRTGKVVFEGYINGEFVPYSGSSEIMATARRINDQLIKGRIEEEYCRLCGSQRCEGVDSEWFSGCEHINER